MSECQVEFSQPLTKGTITHLVIEYLKFVLYSRGQLPDPLDTLIQSIKGNTPFENLNIENHVIFCDDPNVRCDRSGLLKKTNPSQDRRRQSYEDTIKKFDNFFMELCNILETKDVLEVVMNLGPNTKSPKELHRITLPTNCDHTECSQISTPLEKHRLFMFKEILKNGILNGSRLDNILPITIFLYLKTGVSFTEHMQLERQYSVPKKSLTLHLNCECQISTSHIGDNSHPEIAEETNVQNGLWVKIKPALKGFKALSEK